MQTMSRRAVLVLLTTGCTADAVTSPGSKRDNPIASASLVAASVPMHGRCEMSPLGPPIVSFPIITETDGGLCQLAHLGRVTFYGTQQINAVTRTQTAQVTLAAANGDELRFTNVGSNTSTGPTTIRFSGTMTIVGGTGRFSGATGQLSAEGTADLVSGNAAMTLDGSIAFDASGRSSQ